MATNDSSSTTNVKKVSKARDILNKVWVATRNATEKVGFADLGAWLWGKTGGRFFS